MNKFGKSHTATPDVPDRTPRLFELCGRGREMGETVWENRLDAVIRERHKIR